MQMDYRFSIELHIVIYICSYTLMRTPNYCSSKQRESKILHLFPARISTSLIACQKGDFLGASLAALQFYDSEVTPVLLTLGTKSSCSE